MNTDECLPDEPDELRAFGQGGGDHDADRLLSERMPVQLAQTLRNARVPSGEVAGARARVQEQVFSHIPRGASRFAARRLTRRIAGALALSVFSLALWISMLATTALPSSPLYTVKRGEEWIAYQTAWSPARRGEVLLLAASRRLNEAQTVVDEQEGAAVSLALELRSNLMEMVTLYQTLHFTRATSDESQSVVAGLVLILAKESDAARDLEVDGKQLLADTLRENVRLARDTLARRHLALP